MKQHHHHTEDLCESRKPVRKSGQWVPEAASSDTLTEEEVRAIIAQWMEEHSGFTPVSAAPTTKDVAEGLGIAPEEVTRLLEAVRARHALEAERLEMERQRAEAGAKTAEAEARRLAAEAHKAVAQAQIRQANAITGYRAEAEQSSDFSPRVPSHIAAIVIAATILIAFIWFFVVYGM